MVFWLFYVLFILFLFILAIEMGSRWYLKKYGKYYVWPPYHKFLFHLDKEIFPELDEHVRFEINGDGERGNEVPSTNNFYRILVAGGSPVECASLDQSKSWPIVLEKILNKPEHLRIIGKPRVHVGNIGRSGIASAHLDLIFQKILPQYRHLDAIIIYVGGNDVFQWLQSGAPKRYLSPEGSITDCFNYHPEGPFEWKLKSLAFSTLLKKHWWKWNRPLVEKKGVGKRVKYARLMRANAKEILTSIDDPENMLNNFEWHFRRIVQNAKFHADYVLVINQPWFEKKYSAEEAAHIWHGGLGDVWKGENVTVFYSLDILCKLMRMMNNRANKVADELCVDRLDLMPILDQGLETFYDFVHFTPGGAMVVAESVAKKIISRVGYNFNKNGNF